MKFVLLAACALAVATPAYAAADAPAAKETAEKAPAKKDFDPAQMMAVFDKLFPAQPEPAQARLALSRTTVRGLLPDGTYARMMDGVMDGVVERVLNLSGADFGETGKDGKADAKLTLRDKAAKEDPHFEERMRIMEKVIGEEMAKIAAIIEPKLREGLARSMARRFDERQLTDINAFLATETGSAFGRQSMAMWVDPDVLRSMIGSFPEMMTALPAAMQRVEAATAHLPKPKKAEVKDSKKTK